MVPLAQSAARTMAAPARMSQEAIGAPRRTILLQFLIEALTMASAGGVIGVDHFGASAPSKVVMEKYGFNVDNVCQHALRVLEGVRGKKRKKSEEIRE